MWDVAFALGSILSAFLIGVTMGNIVRGIPLDADHEFAGSLLSLLNPYSLTMGVTTVLLFAMHRAIYVVMKTEGDLRPQRLPLHGLLRPRSRAFSHHHQRSLQ